MRRVVLGGSLSNMESYRFLLVWWAVSGPLVGSRSCLRCCCAWLTTSVLLRSGSWLSPTMSWRTALGNRHGLGVLPPYETLD